MCHVAPPQLRYYSMLLAFIQLFYVDVTNILSSKSFVYIYIVCVGVEIKREKIWFFFGIGVVAILGTTLDGFPFCLNESAWFCTLLAVLLLLLLHRTQNQQLISYLINFMNASNPSEIYFVMVCVAHATSCMRVYVHILATQKSYNNRCMKL